MDISNYSKQIHNAKTGTKEGFVFYSGAFIKAKLTIWERKIDTDCLFPIAYWKVLILLYLFGKLIWTDWDSICVGELEGNLLIWWAAWIVVLQTVGPVDIFEYWSKYVQLLVINYNFQGILPGAGWSKSSELGIHYITLM